MKKITGNKTTTFKTGTENFMIDIVEHKTGDVQFYVWLYRENIGIKECIIGYMKECNCSVPEIVCNLETYLMIPDRHGKTWYEAYDEKYR